MNLHSFSIENRSLRFHNSEMKSVITSVAVFAVAGLVKATPYPNNVTPPGVITTAPKPTDVVKRQNGAGSTWATPSSESNSLT